MKSTNIPSYQDAAPFAYPEDEHTRISYDSLAYSETEIGTTISDESRRLNGYPVTREHWLQQPRIKVWLAISVTLAILTVFLLTSGALDSEWMDNMWQIGLKGALAQGMADASLIKTTIRGSNPAVYLGNSKKEEQLELTDSPPDGCETTIMLLRHCEKGNLKSHCNYAGFERAAFLATLFGNGKERWPAPHSIYALKTGGRGLKNQKVNYREVETVEYIAEKHGLDIDESYKTSDDKRLVKDLLTSILNGEQCGKFTLISWKHSDLPKLAHLLGCGPYEGCPMSYRGREFDEVWQIKYVYRSFHHGPHSAMTHKHWDIFGSVQHEGFDPLAFSKATGDYPGGGKSHGGSWVQPSQQLFD